MLSINYQINVETDRLGNPTFCVINGTYSYNCVPHDSLQQNILNAIAAYQEENSRLSLADGLYNKAVYWPVELEIELKRVISMRYTIAPTNHYYDRCDFWRIPASVCKALIYGEVVEVQVENGQIVKLITRLPNHKNPDEDICGALWLGYNEPPVYTFPVPIYPARVKTVWCNSAYDNHTTIDKTKYIQQATANV